MEKEILEQGLNLNRRKFLSRLSLGVGSAALGSLLIPDLFKGGNPSEDAIMDALPHFAPKAKRVIYLFQLKFLFEIRIKIFKAKIIPGFHT